MNLMHTLLPKYVVILTYIHYVLYSKIIGTSIQDQWLLTLASLLIQPIKNTHYYKPKRYQFWLEIACALFVQVLT